MSIAQGARAFALTAAAYERARPTYPDDAVDWVLETVPLRRGDAVADVAAGTGKLTRLLAARGLDVVAIEPVAEMRAVLEANVRGVRAVDGVAEAIPLADASVQAVTVAQAYHWFDADRAPREIARVLRDDGALAIFANVRDKTDPLQAKLERVMARHRGAYPNPAWPETLVDHPVFAAEYREFRHDQVLDAETFVERVASVSWIAALAPAENASVLAETRALAAEAGDTILLPYITQVFVCRPRR